MKSIKVLLFIGSIFLSGNATAQEKFQMAYKYEKGKTYRYKEEQRFNSVQEVSGQEMKARGSTFSLMKLVVADVSESGDITFNSSLEDLKVNSSMMSMDTTMVLNEFLNKNVLTIVSQKGKLLDQKIPDTVQVGDKFMDRGNSLFTIIKEFVVLPEKALEIGDTWKDERTDTTRGTQMVTKTDIVHTLAGIEEKNGHSCFKTSFKGKTEIAGKMTQMGMEFFIEGSGETSGTAWFDKVTCIIIFKESTSDQEMTMALTGEMQMTIPITSTTHSTFTLLD